MPMQNLPAGQFIGESGMPEWTPEGLAAHLKAQAAQQEAAAQASPEPPPAPVPPDSCELVPVEVVRDANGDVARGEEEEDDAEDAVAEEEEAAEQEAAEGTPGKHVVPPPPEWMKEMSFKDMQAAGWFAVKAFRGATSAQGPWRNCRKL